MGYGFVCVIGETMNWIPTLRYLCVSALLFVASHHAGAKPLADSEVVLHVQVVKDDAIVEDATVTARQGATAIQCFGTPLDPSDHVPGQPLVKCDGLRVEFSPRELQPEIIQAAFAVEYYRRIIEGNTTSSRFQGYSISVNHPMKTGAPIVAGNGTYTFRLHARY
jgi:hypothetical protein